MKKLFLLIALLYLVILYISCSCYKNSNITLFSRLLMKKYSFLCLLFICFYFIVHTTTAQCDAEVLNNKALKSLPKGFVFLKSYKVDGKEGMRKSIEYTCVLNNETQYALHIASSEGNANGIIAILYDAQRTELATSQVNNKLFQGWTFNCKATGVYYLVFSFKDSQNYCGGAVMGFKTK
jgi:hypothetical protein